MDFITIVILVLVLVFVVGYVKSLTPEQRATQARIAKEATVYATFTAGTVAKDVAKAAHKAGKAAGNEVALNHDQLLGGIDATIEEAKTKHGSIKRAGIATGRDIGDLLCLDDINKSLEETLKNQAESRAKLK